MKLLAFILAYTILALNGVPCRDSFPMDDHTEIVHTHKGQESQEEHASHASACSPFCVCACCSIDSTSHVSIMIEMAAPETRIAHNARYEAAILKNSPPIWQPPRLMA